MSERPVAMGAVRATWKFSPGGISVDADPSASSAATSGPPELLTPRTFKGDFPEEFPVTGTRATRT